MSHQESLPDEKEQEDNQENTEEEKSENKKQTKDGDTPRDGRKQQKEYFKEELKRLKNSLNKESSKIKRPPKKKYTPDTFNTLQPYYSTHTAAFLIELNDDNTSSPAESRAPSCKPEDVRHSYVSRSTALGLTDPWVDYNMDVTILPKIDTRTSARGETDQNKKKKKSNKERPPKSGSTRLPRFPAVEVPAGDLTNRTLYYSDVPMLRAELRKKYTDNSDAKVQAEYTRTKKDFYRMELDKMHEFHPTSRKHMRSCYFAYLQNNKGSKKAIYECVKTVEKENQEEAEEDAGADEADEEEQQQQPASARSSLHQQQSIEASAWVTYQR